MLSDTKSEAEMYHSFVSLQLSYPKREPSTLYSLPPLNPGTAQVESLTGYIARLAEVHCVHSGILMERIIAPAIEKKYSSADLHKIYTYTGALNGTGVMATDIITALEQLTKQRELSRLTFLRWSCLLPSRHLLHHHRVWCPVCYQEWKRHNYLLYEPLVWTLKLIQVCRVHHVPLQQKCPHCYRLNLSLSWRSRPGYCSRCQKWLGAAESSSSHHLPFSETDLNWHIWTARNLEELLASEELAIDIPGALESIADRLTEGNLAALARRLQMPKNTVWLWSKGKNKPSLQALLAICYRLGVRLMDFLTNSVTEIPSRQSLPTRLHSSADGHGGTHLNLSEDSATATRKNPTFDSDRVQQALLKVLQAQEEPPPSLEEVARRICCDRRTVYRHFPKLCQQVSARYTRYQQIQYYEAVKQCCQEVEQTVATLHQQGAYPTEKLVSQYLSHPGYLRYQRVKTVFQQTKERLYIADSP